MSEKHRKQGIAISFYRFERWFYTHHMRHLAQIAHRFMQIILGCTIPPGVELGKNVRIPHFHGIVIHHQSKIGDRTIIYQNVTIGGRNGQIGAIVGSDCIIGAGSCLLGNIKIGNHVKIGANAVVLEDIPDGCTVVGVPGKIINQDPYFTPPNI